MASRTRSRLTVGVLEPRDVPAVPGTNLFDAAFYLRANPDVAAAVRAGEITAEGHFGDLGGAEGRDPSIHFDTSLYVGNNPDVFAAVRAGETTAFQHFLNFGADED